MKYLDLVRDCIEVFDLPKLPPNDVQHAHVFDGTVGRSFKYAACDNDWNRKHRQTSRPGAGSDSGEPGGEAGDDTMNDADEDGSDELDTPRFHANQGSGTVEWSWPDAEHRLKMAYEEGGIMGWAEAALRELEAEGELERSKRGHA